MRPGDPDEQWHVNASSGCRLVSGRLADATEKTTHVAGRERRGGGCEAVVVVVGVFAAGMLTVIAREKHCGVD